MGKIVRIYCEGTSGSHDIQILNKVIDGLSNVEIVPLGSVRGARAIIEYKKNSDTVKADNYLFFRDRDFDRPIPSEPQLEFESDTYYSYPNTIENYLLDVSCFYDFVCSQKLVAKYDLTSKDKVKQVFIEAARHIQHYQTVRHTLGKMRQGNISFGTKLSNKSGMLPPQLDEMACKQAAMQLINDSKEKANTWTDELFEETYCQFKQQFDDAFFNNLKFLYYFHGKDFAAAFKKYLPDFPIELYYKAAKDSFDYKKHADLVELRTIVEGYLKP